MIRRALIAVVIPISASYAVAACLEGCYAYERPASPADAIAICTDEAREEFYERGGTRADADAVFASCMKAKGFDPGHPPAGK